MQEEIRKIIHVDMDAFYASVEQRENPELRGKALAVGSADKRGVVMTASYEARKFGVHSAMPSAMAIKRCPGLLFIKPHFDLYKAVSKEINKIFKSYTDLVEPLSLDEAYLDVTQNKVGNPSATIIAKEIKQKIKSELHLTASAGVSINKFLAKVASDIQKPDGLTVIRPEQVEKFIEKLKIEKIPGIGKVTAQKMQNLGIHTGSDLKKFELNFLVQKFGKTGTYFYNIVRGIHKSPVVPDRIRKSIGAELTFDDDIEETEAIMKELDRIAEILEGRNRRTNSKGKTITLKIKYHDFQLTTRSKTLNQYISSKEDLLKVAEELLYSPEKPLKPIRLLGIYLSNLAGNTDLIISDQLSLEF